MIHRRTAFGLTAAALLASVAPADAVVSGRNGRIAFTSGRAAGDTLAQIYAINPVTPIGLEGPFSRAGFQNRHASWSPDRTKLVFASGTPGTLAAEDYDLYVRDFDADPDTITALDATQVGDSLSSDHPAWSPDGTRIAYEAQRVNDSTDRDIMVKTFGTAAPAVALTNAGNFELKAAWSPDSSEIYYAQSPTAPPTTQFDIVKKAAGAGPGTAPTNVANSVTVDEYQPSISPDGSKICYTRQSTLSNTSTADVYIAELPGMANQRDISDATGIGDINCSWSPDGSKVAFSNGTFSNARLMVERADDADDIPALNELANDPGGDNFDGNADWGVDGSPDCPDIAVTTNKSTAVTIQLECADTGPEWERTDPNGYVSTQPTHGTTSDASILTNPSTVRYTPDAGFTGEDTFVYNSFDDFGFGTQPGTVTVTVKAPGGSGGGGGGGGGGNKPLCAGVIATIVGTAGADDLLGTAGDDVIAGLGADDRIRGGGGDDVVCGGPGIDRIGAGGGNDRVRGGGGGDRLAGNGGRDRLKGGTGRDRLRGGSGRDRLDGGKSRDVCRGGAGRDRGRNCERRTSIP